MEQENSLVSKQIESIVRAKGIRLLLDETVVSVEPSQLITHSDKAIQFDSLIWLTGPKAHPIFERSGLPVDKKGFLLVKNTLQSVDYPNIFGAGDCVTLEEHQWVPKAGVYAVREAPFLWNNLIGYLEAGELREYRPQSSFLSILSTGDRQGFITYKGLAFHSGWAWHLKRKIDTGFMRRYQK